MIEANILSGEIKDIQDITIVTNFSSRIESKLRDISQSFENEFVVRTFLSVTTGSLCDNRRSGTKNDKDNLESLVRRGVFPILWKDALGVNHSLTAVQAESLVFEMIDDGTSIYYHKWDLEAQIKAIKDDQLSTTPTMTEEQAIIALEAIAW